MKRGFIFGFLTVLIFCHPAAFAISLMESIDTALKNNDNVVMVQKKADAASAKVGQAFASYLPAINLQGNYSRNYQAPIRTVIMNTPLTLGVDDVAAVKGWQASFTQNVFTFGKLENALSIAMENAKTAREEYRKAKQNCIYDVTQSYYNYLKAIKMLRLQEESLEMAAAHLNQARKMFTVGMATRADILRSEVSVSKAKQGLIRARNSLEVAKASFNTAIGKSIDIEIRIDDIDLSERAYEKNFSYQSMLKDAFSSRPDWKQIKGSVEISERSRGAAMAGWLPSVNLQGYYQWSNTDYDIDTLNYDARNWQVAGVASWSIFDGFLTQSKIKEAEANLLSSYANREMVRKGVELDVKQAFLNYSAAVEVLDTAKAGIKSARENHDIAEIRYKNGLATNIEVLDAQTSLTQAEIDLLSAQVDMELAKLAISKARGVLDTESLSVAEVNYTFEGKMTFVGLEGGFWAFIDNSGNTFTLTGKASEEIFSGAKSGKTGIKIIGAVKKDAVTFTMAGRVLEVKSYEWN